MAGAQKTASHPVSASAPSRGKGFQQRLAWGTCGILFIDLKKKKGIQIVGGVRRNTKGMGLQSKGLG